MKMKMQTHNFVRLMAFCEEFELDTEDVYDMISDSDSVSFGDAYDTLISIGQLFNILDRFGMDTEEIRQKFHRSGWKSHFENQHILIALGS